MESFAWIVLLMGVLEIILGLFTLTRGARDAPAGLPAQTAVTVSRLKGWGYVFLGVTFIFASLSARSQGLVWTILCVVAAVISAVLLWRSVAMRRSTPSDLP